MVKKTSGGTPSIPDLKLQGTPPAGAVPKSEAYDELQKKIIDVLVDAIKYIASSCAITISLYSQILQGYLNNKAFVSDPASKALLLAPLILWLCVIISTIAGIFPRSYKAYTDYEKQLAVKKINGIKKVWLIISIGFFLAGFAVFIYIMFAQVWSVFPFHK